MSTPKILPRVSVDCWKVDGFRLSAFPMTPFTESQTDWWQKLLKSNPDSQIKSQRDGFIEEGAFSQARLTNRIMPDRIEWRFSPSFDQELVDGLLTLPGSFSNLEPFINLMKSWVVLESSPLLSRIAIGGAFLLPVNTEIDGNYQLSSYLPNLKIDSEHETDILYQVNRPRTFKIGPKNLLINRLMKWSVGTFRLIDIAVTNRVVPLERSSVTACRLELDINTANFKGKLNKTDLPTIIQKMLDWCLEIIEQGDIK